MPGRAARRAAPAARPLLAARRAGCQLRAAGCWLLAAGCWSSLVGSSARCGSRLSTAAIDETAACRQRAAGCSQVDASLRVLGERAGLCQTLLEDPSTSSADVG